MNYIVCIFLLRVAEKLQQKTARWSVQPVKADKSCSYVPRLLRVIICMRLQYNERMNHRVQLEVDDPRRFSVHLAPIPQLPTQDNIVASQKSRFEDQDKQLTILLHKINLDCHSLFLLV